MEKGIYTKFQEHTKEFHPVSCAIENEKSIFIVFEKNVTEEDENLRSMVALYRPEMESVWAARGFEHCYREKSCTLPESDTRLLVVDWHGKVTAKQQPDDFSQCPEFTIEEPMPIARNCTIMQLRNIAGKAYVAAGWRTVFRREGPNEWTCLRGNDQEEIEEFKKTNWEYGFNDIGGFAEDDIYACGGNGDVMHYDGKTWRQLYCPTNEKLLSLCCAPDGKVYIGGLRGTLVVGRDDQWEVLKSKAPDEINDLAWFKDRLYMTCRIYGINELYEGKIRTTPGTSGMGQVVKPGRLSEGNRRALKEAGADDAGIDLVDSLEVPTATVLAPASVHTLATDGNLLLAAGTDGVVAFDGKGWQVLFSPFPTEIGGGLEF
ncbi:MAG: hypothetical protein KZQ81_18245 [Candidatus Thiodiazotropha sp. (ex Rostrolucina anterorostrata)]|nr:hypothetical protein [Candidatus Thiodiazotropha sp. (ex Rostrolucina anterorostrata)]